MQEINLETAKLAKEKGFDWKTQYEWLESSHGYFDDDEHGIHPSNRDYGDMGFDTILKMPTQSLLQKWLREEHKIHIELQCDSNCDKYFILIYYKTNGVFSLDDSLIYEEALEIGLQESLKIIENE